MPSGKKLTAKQYEELGRVTAAVYETGYLDAAKSYKQSFIKGLFQGVGATLGATVLVALILWMVSFFDEIPLIGGLIEEIVQVVRKS